MACSQGPRNPAARSLRLRGSFFNDKLINHGGHVGGLLVRPNWRRGMPSGMCRNTNALRFGRYFAANSAQPGSCLLRCMSQVLALAWISHTNFALS
jgi:hypothetical protein